MAATKKTDTPADEKTNSGTPAPESTDSADTALAAAAGISEGEVKALRDEAGLNQLAGHDMDIHAWQVSPAGKTWAEGEKDREKKYKDEEKSYKEQFEKDGLRPAEQKYAEAVSKAE